MRTDPIHSLIAALAIAEGIDNGLPIEERLSAAMSYSRAHASELFVMCESVSDEDLFRAAVAAVAIKGSEDEKDRISQSLRPLQMLAAFSQGVPVDFDSMQIGDDMLPLNDLWFESGKQPRASDSVD